MFRSPASGRGHFGHVQFSVGIVENEETLYPTLS